MDVGLSTQKIAIDLGNNQLKTRVLLTLSALLACASLLSVWYNAFVLESGYHLVIVANLIAFSAFSYVTIKTLTGNKQPWHTTLVVYGYSGLICFALMQFPAQSTVVQWWYSIPILTLFLLPRTHAFFVCLVMFSIAVFIRIDNNVTQLNLVWYAGLLNLIFPYLIIMGVTNVYEKMRQQNEQQLTEYALTDSLTKSYNRLALKSTFAQYQQLPEQYNLLLLDIDHFKSINDSYGHEAGDQVLKQLAHLFKQQAGEQQVFRIGGEEFVVLIAGNDDDSAVLAQALRCKVSEFAMQLGQQSLYVKISAGLVRNIANQPLAQVLKQADQKLYQAKNNGRDQIVY